MSKYTKFNSSYILRKKHQNIKDGSLLYRDWVSIGGWEQLAPGKTPYFKDSNFMFTINNTPSYQRKHKYGVWSNPYVYDDVKNAFSQDEVIKINYNTDDVRDFAYFGSCVELIRSSIENIICNFPAQISGTSTLLQKDYGDFEVVNNVFLVKNDFNINVHNKEVKINNDINPLRFLTYSYSSYELNGKDISKYEVVFSENYSNIISCPSQYPYYEEGNELFTIYINVDELIIKGLYIDNDIILVSNNNTFVIKPKENVINDYFNNLEGFEKILLNRNTKPLYKNTFLTPIEGERGVKIVKRDYIWPSNDYQIVINSPQYIEYVNSLISLATIMDEYYCDNLYRSLTHESIKNYDWTYTREYDDEIEQNNIEGGDRVAQLLRVYARSLDDIKRYIDGIGFTNNITYNAINNQMDYLLSDNLELKGILPYSITNGLVDNSVITDDFLHQNNLKWYTSINTSNFTPYNMDTEFMRRMILNANCLLRTKGTLHSIEMIMAMFGFSIDNNDFEITEEYKTVIPKINIQDTYYGINQNKDYVRLYEDDYYSGVPLKDIIIDDTTTITIPYYDKNKIYDGYLYFQSNGGWGSDFVSTIKDNITIYPYIYRESLNYLNTVSKIEDLFDIDKNNIEDNDIYYVFDISSIINYDNTITDISKVSHCFYVKNKYATNEYSGWGNIKDANDDIKKKADYIENIISDNEGNNPHVGYGKYDNGHKYFEYMAQPFYYAIENNLLNSSDVEIAQNNEFEIKTHYTKNGDKKVKIISNSEIIDQYYLNSKIIKITNKLGKNDNFINYFNNVILKYITQVIPSTTILILEDYNK